MKYEEYTGNGHRLPDRATEVKSDVDTIRHEMAQTLTQLEERLSVSELIDEVVSRVREVGTGSGDFLRNLGGTLRDHPVPVLLVGIGLASLIRSERSDRPRPRPLSRGDVSEGKEAVSERVHAVKENAGHAAERVKEGAIRAKDKISESVPALRGRLGDTIDRAKDRSRDIIENQPLVLAGLGLAAGALLAAAPLAKTERKLLTPIGQGLKRGAREAAQEDKYGTADQESSAQAAENARAHQSEISTNPSGTKSKI